MTRDSSDQYFIGVDVGTGSARACIVANSGKLLSVASHPTQTFQSRANCYEQSTRDIWQSICVAVKTACNEADVDKEAIQSIVFSATCSLAVFSQDTNKHVSVVGPEFTHEDHNVILWMHSAASEEANLINATRHPVLQNLGGAISPLMGLAKVLWLKNNMPAELFDNCKFFDLHDAIAHIATGGRAFACNQAPHNSSDVLGFGVDGTIKGWRSDLYSQIGLDELARVSNEFVGGVCKHNQPLPIGAPLGLLCDLAAEQLGLPCHVSVGLGVIDCYAGWVGTVGAQVPELDVPPYERIAIVAGTSACHVLASDRPDFVPGVWGPYKHFLLPNSHAIVGGQSAVGRLLEHVIETHPAKEIAMSQAQAKGVSIFEHLNQHLERMQNQAGASSITYLARHIFFYGDHYGNRSPIADSNMSGSVIGLTGDVSVDNLALMYYAAMEFLALQSRHIISTITSNNHRVRVIFMSGSLCQNRVFIDLLSTVTSLPVVLPEYTQAAVCYGSALLAARAVRAELNDEQSELWSVMTALSRPGSLFKPARDDHVRKLLDMKYNVMLDQAERQREYRRMINSVSLQHDVDTDSC